MALALLAVSGCGYDGDFLFHSPTEDAPGVIDLKAQSGGAFEPVELNLAQMTDIREQITVLANTDNRTPAQDAELAQLQDDLEALQDDGRAAVLAATTYAEVGPNSEPFPSGATFEFFGNGGDICIFVDPELVYWPQSVSTISPSAQYRFPDNVYDDGDIDLRVGLSVYYRGTPGLRMGGFEVQYADDLGNGVAIDLVACKPLNDYQNQEPHAGRASVEYCTVRNTQPGVSYTAALEAFSLPRDDGRLAFGFVVSNGPCDGATDSLVGLMAPVGIGNTGVNQECVITGEALPAKAEGEGANLYYGYQEGRSYPGSEDFEETYCSGSGLLDFCREEVRALRDQGLQCDYQGVDADPTRRCFCGDRAETPSPGARR
ncbi:MAG: hypothetical protein H6734_24435 [Alphaproteobacteria bacterium]|nr:hypothetical protein [Alphaproteobacteria bacterium]